MVRPPASRPKVLLIGWDGADWQMAKPLLDAGLMPTLNGLIKRGVAGNIASLQPMLSPMLWNSVSTGKLATKHGIHGFFEPDHRHGGVRPVSSTSRKTRAVWNMLHNHEKRCNVVNWWASHPAEPLGGCVASNLIGEIQPESGGQWRVPAGVFFPADRADKYASLKVSSTEVGPDQILPFIPNAAEIDQLADGRLRDFQSVMAECLTTHAITTAIMEAEPWDFMATYYTAIDHFAHLFMDFHPPRREHISEHDFHIYSQVMQGVYRFHDMMLERLLHLAGPETTIILCSDHGFQSQHGRLKGIPREPAGPAAWHRPYGMLVMAGNGIRESERVHGASLLDITPTILHLFDAPIGEDMDGRVLIDAMIDPAPIQSIPTWDDLAGDFADPDKTFQSERPTGSALLQQFADLGYVEDPSIGAAALSESAEIENAFNEARCFKSIGQHEEARLILERLLHQRPWEDRFLTHLADCYLRAGYLEQCQFLLDKAYTPETQNVGALIINAQLRLIQRDETGAEIFLEKATALSQHNPVVLSKIGEFHLQRRDASRALTFYQAALALDEDLVEAHAGISTAHLRLGNLQSTIDSAMTALGLVYRLPRAHLNLGIALARAGEVDKSIAAFETLLNLFPKSIAALRWLSFLHSQTDGSSKNLETEKAKRYAERYSQLIAIRDRQRMVVDDHRRRKFNLPGIPAESQRLEQLKQARPDQPSDQPKSDRTLFIVSGIPRSGTSLMMQILAAGGMKIKSDGQRAADVDNPRGYFEWDDVKRLPTNPEILDDTGLDNHAIKITSPLLRVLPKHYKYKIIFMRRDLQEVAASQAKMSKRLGKEQALEGESLNKGLSLHLGEIDRWLESAPHVEVLCIEFSQLLATPEPQIARIIDFFGSAQFNTPEKMPAVIDRTLHRNQ